MIQVRSAEDKGRTDRGWLDSRHTLEPGEERLTSLGEREAELLVFDLA